MVTALIEAALGVAPVSVATLGGGCVAEVYCVELPSGERVVAKVDRGAEPKLDVEGFMLDYLRAHSDLPVPTVRHCASGLLVMDWVEGRQGASGRAEEHAATLLAGLHGVTAPRFGFERDTLIGALPQPNPESARWVPFFAEHRLLFMAREADRARGLGRDTMQRIETLADRLPERLPEPQRPALLHGDVWSGNVLAAGGQIRAFVDPAIYYGDPEIELAFITLFGTFGERFFACYREQRGLAPGFFEERRHLYNLYPLLVHVRLFGGSYLAQVQTILQRYG